MGEVPLQTLRRHPRVSLGTQTRVRCPDAPKSLNSPQVRGEAGTSSSASAPQSDLVELCVMERLNLRTLYTS